MDNENDQFIDECKKWFLETRNTKFFNDNEKDELPTKIMIPICVKNRTWILCLINTKRRMIQVVDSDIKEQNDDKSKEYYFEKLKVVNWVTKWLLLYKKIYNTQQIDQLYLFHPREMFIKEKEKHKCGMFEISFMNNKFVAQQQNKNDSWIHCIRNMISKLSKQNVPKDFSSSTKLLLKKNVFSMLQKTGIGGQDIDIFYPPDDINKLDGKDVQEEKDRKSSWIRAIQIYKLCVKSGYFDSSDTSDKSQNPFDDDDNDDRSLDSRNDTPIWMGGKNLKLIKSKNNSTKKGE